MSVSGTKLSEFRLMSAVTEKWNIKGDVSQLRDKKITRMCFQSKGVIASGQPMSTATETLNSAYLVQQTGYHLNDVH